MSPVPNYPSPAGLHRRAIWCWLVLLALGSGLGATPLPFNIPAQSADRALADFTQQSKSRLLYNPNELQDAESTAVFGELEPADALTRLLRDTGFGARLRDDHFIITRIPRPLSALVGRIATANSEPLVGTRVIIPELRRVAVTNRHGEFRFDDINPGSYLVIASRDGFHPLHINDVNVTANDRTYLRTAILLPAGGTTQLEPVIVEGRLNRRGPLDPGPTIWGPRQAGGNLDLNRTANDVLPFIIYDRDRITRSGVVNLNEFLRRELLDTDATSLPPEQSLNNSSHFSTGSSNLSLRGFATDETVVLVNGRRLPEVLTAGSGPQAPDVNFIPLSLVQQVQVLPASASALYSGNAVGGVINILLRPDNLQTVTEVTATYTDATEGYSAPNSSMSLLHSQSLLDGKISLRLNANFVETTPATESELKFVRDNATTSVPDKDELYRATPNVRLNGAGSLFPDSSTRVTSVAPGADGTGGLAAFADRAGHRNYDLYDSPGTLASANNGVDLPYGRHESRELFFASALYKASDWFELAFDAAYSSTVINRGFDVFRADLFLARDNPLNPFDRNVNVSLFDTPVELGQDYNEAILDFYSLVGSALMTLPWDFKMAIDLQYAHSATRYRGVEDWNRGRWQDLVDRGDYNPLRDTQVFGPPQAYYDEVLIYAGGRGQFVTVGDYETLDGAFRLTHDALHLPTGNSVFNIGADYRIATLKDYEGNFRYGDGTLARPPERWQGRTLERVSVFTELQAPLFPRSRLPSWINAIETDLATRFVIADTSAETNIAPTLGLKMALANGVTVRGSFTTSNRFPTPLMSQQLGNGISTGGGVNLQTIKDPRRNDEEYDIEVRSRTNPDLQSESSITQTVGIIFETGERNRIRASLDFFDTQKTNEIVGLNDSVAVLNLEEYFPELVQRAPRAPGDPFAAGRVDKLFTTARNLAGRHSQNWMATFDFARSDVFGGTFDLRSRVVYFERFDREIYPDDPKIDEIRDPSGSAAGLLEYRATFGGGWSNAHFAMGLDGQYFHSRRLPETEWAEQGARTIDPYWQTDFYTQADLGHWLLPADSRYGLKGQLRINNVFKNSYPYYGYVATGVQPYGDWRGRTFSLSITAEF
ncbi:TonB-dependent receptor plug domain-containing protein [Synoicihabitans lomoniglobus]|uniref:TonB-dependent receptor plug domain-containing protein n=1 Tax=Synoicihabitans lomoniglobus TaxID=2909285 RepID=UPI002ED5AF7A|nr:TonB-dependent receptor plug domain-containing protein [Opitutaceae bacterium LMO-M01]